MGQHRTALIGRPALAQPRQRHLVMPVTGQPLFDQPRPKHVDASTTLSTRIEATSAINANESYWAPKSGLPSRSLIC